MSEEDWSECDHCDEPATRGSPDGGLYCEDCWEDRIADMSDRERAVEHLEAASGLAEATMYDIAHGEATKALEILEQLRDETTADHPITDE